MQKPVKVADRISHSSDTAPNGLGHLLGLSRSDLRVGLRLAQGQVLRGAINDALSTYATLVLLDPGNLDALIGLSVCAFELRQLDLSRMVATAAVVLAPDDARGWLHCGRAGLANGRNVEAQRDLERACVVARKMKDPNSFRAAARLLEKLGTTPT